MSSRFLARAAALAAVAPVLWAAHAAAADAPPKPPVTLQVQPVAKLLADAKATAQMLAGPAAAAELNKQIDKFLEDKLGDKGFEGLDLTRPLAGYLYLPEKLDLAKLNGNPPPAEALKGFSGVLVVPVTGEKEFLDLLERVEIDAEPVKGAKGLYELSQEGADDDTPLPFRLRFHAGHAYIGVNAADEALAADAVVPAADLIVAGDTAQLSYRVYYQRLPDGLKKAFADLLKQLPEKAAAAPVPESWGGIATKLVGLYKRYGDQLIADGDVAAVRVRLDPKTGDLGYEGSFSARKGSPLAKEIADRKPTANSFVGLLTEDTVGGFVLQMPLFAPEVRDAVADATAEGWKQNGVQVPPQYKEIAEEVVAGFTRTVKSGEFDLAAAMTGPDKDGHYAVAAAVSYDGAAKLEKLVRKLHADAPEEIQNQIKLDAAKAGDVSIHRMPVGLFLPPPAKALFGDKAGVAVAFAPTGIYLTFGPDSIGAMKAALAAKPGPAKAMDVVVNPGRLGKVIEASGAPGGAQTAEMIGTEDKLLSVLFFSLDGGNELTFRYGTNIKLFGRALFGARAGGTFQPVPAELK